MWTENRTEQKEWRGQRIEQNKKSGVDREYNRPKRVVWTENRTDQKEWCGQRIEQNKKSGVDRE